SYETAFIVQGNDAKEEMVNSNSSWKSIQDSAYAPLPINKSRLRTYIVTAEGEKLDGNRFAWGFESPDFDDSHWSNAAIRWYAAKSRSFGTDGNWMLVPRSIPLAEESIQHFAGLRRSNRNLGSVESFLTGSSTIEIPAHSQISLLFDQGSLSNAYPVLQVSRGKNSVIQLSYAEALVNQKGEKGNRDSIEGKELMGFSDEYTQDGGDHRIYSPLFFRTFRYLEMKIETQDEPMTIEDFHSLFTGYPFKENAYFKSNDQGLFKIWQTGWRTARLCAVDTYFDCPYYEQLQYVGDTRIQAMISLYVSGDDRLMRKAIDDISHSFIADGLTQSRYPSRDMQVIPTFSLWWVCMIHDYWMHRKDDAFVLSHLNGIDRVLEWYRERISEKGILGPLSWWQFVDWSWPWVDSIRVGGVPPGASKGGSSIITLQYVYTLQRAASLMSHYGKKELADKYLKLAQSLTKRTMELCWDQERGLLADDYNKKEFSQHANILAVLTDAVTLS
ncbi:MAG: alpha-rhamnosidase, partial [Chitinophagales bacterium]